MKNSSKNKKITKNSLSSLANTDSEKYLFMSNVQIQVERVFSCAVVFTDLQGSTKWLHDKGPQDVFRALEEFFSILSSTFNSYRGEIIKRTGDGLMAVFETFEDAAKAVVAAQQKLASARTDQVRPFLIPPMRAGISVGEAYKISHPELGVDYFGKVCAEASRVVDLCNGHHILVSTAALDQANIGVGYLKQCDIAFSKPVSVYRKGLNEISVSELLYKPFLVVDPNQRKSEIVDDNYYICPQVISKSRPDLSPFNFYENSNKAESEVDNLIVDSKEFKFLIFRGIIAASSSPFNRFMKLLADKKFSGKKISSVCVGILNPAGSHLKTFYKDVRKISKNVVSARIAECKESIKDARIKLTRFHREGIIDYWEIFIYDQKPVWRMMITDKGLIATPYGGESRIAENIVLMTDKGNTPFYDAFERHYSNICENIDRKWSSKSK